MKVRPGRCLVCGCTDRHGCAGGCWWVDDWHTLGVLWLRNGAPLAACAAALGKRTGRAVPLALSTAQTRDGVQYAVSHFRDCPDAKAWGR